MFILDELSAFAMTSRVTDQAPPGYGEGLAFLMYTAIVLTVAPTILAAAFGGVAGWLMSIGTGKGVLIGIGSGVIGTVLAWGVLWSRIILRDYFDFQNHSIVSLLLSFVFLGAGVIAPVCIAAILRWKSRGTKAASAF